MSRLRRDLGEVFGLEQQQRPIGVTSNLDTPQKGPSYAGYVRNAFDVPTPNNDSGGVRLFDQTALDVRDQLEALVIHLGDVSDQYVAAFAELQLHKPDDVSTDEWLQALNDARLFLDIWGSRAFKLGWRSDDLFERSTCCCHGLVWELRGRKVAALTERDAEINDDDGGFAWLARSMGGENDR